MHDILSPSQAKARGIIRSAPRVKTLTERPKVVYDHIYDRSAKHEQAPVEVTTKKVEVISMTTTSTPMAKAIEHLSSEQKADVLRRAKLQASGAISAQRGAILGEPALDYLSNIVTKTVTKVVTTTKRTVPHLKNKLSNNRHVARVKQLNPPFVQKYGLYALAGLLIMVTGYVSIDTLITNSRLREQTQITTTDTAVAGATNDLSPTDASQEGSDESDLGPGLIDSYSVAPDMPRVLSIAKIGVTARVIPMGTNADKSVQSPVNIFDSGWYTGSSKPGEKGAVFIDAHASGATRQGLFAYLDQLEKGDTLSLEKGDGSTLTYRVVGKETVPLADVNMTKVLQPYDGVKKGLNLMTCAGQWVQDKETYDHRVVIYTEQV
jgi:LPXTG-site transpeptidase (sortase) family protein